MRASRQFDNQAPDTDADAHHLLDPSKKNVSLTKKFKKFSLLHTTYARHHFLKVIANHVFFDNGVLIRFFGSSRRAHLWALQERD